MGKGVDYVQACETSQRVHENFLQIDQLIPLRMLTAGRPATLHITVQYSISIFGGFPDVFGYILYSILLSVGARLMASSHVLLWQILFHEGAFLPVAEQT
jgi:hypothetical protein